MLKFTAGPYSPDDIEQIAQLGADAFNAPLDGARRYYESVGPDNLRAARIGDRIAGKLASLPCGQFFGGRSVPMAGIAAVAVGAEYRGQGVGAVLMKGELDRLFDAGVALSALYPATVPLYRGVGYEIAGVQFLHDLPIDTIDLRDRTRSLRRETSADAAAIEALHETTAAPANGNIHRSEFFWRRVRTWQGTPTVSYVIESPAGVEGYVFLLKQKSGDPPSATGYYTIQLADFAVATPAAARRLLTFLADHYSQADVVRWKGPPVDPLVLHLREAAMRPTLKDYWMLRIVRARAALEARGYPPGLRAELHLDLRDDLLPGNAGRITLEIADGRGQVRPGGRGDVRLDTRALAALYSSQFTPHQLRLRGDFEAPDAHALAAATIFAGPAPWMRDSF